MAGVEITGLDVTYEGVDRPVHALGGVELTIAGGEPVSVIGPSGCGKSTLLLAVAGLVEPGGRAKAVRMAGHVTVAGEVVRGTPLTTARNLPADAPLPGKTDFHNAAHGLEIRGIPRATIEAQVTEALETVGIADFARSYPGELSGGMRQRLAVARALALDADLLLMDEPLSALDALTRENLQRLLLDLWPARGHTQLSDTHSIEEAVFLGRRVVVLSPRPGVVAHIVNNPGMGTSDYRDSEDFYARCAELRGLLAAEGAFSEEAVS